MHVLANALMATPEYARGLHGAQERIVPETSAPPASADARERDRGGQPGTYARLVASIGSTALRQCRCRYTRTTKPNAGPTANAMRAPPNNTILRRSRCALGRQSGVRAPKIKKKAGCGSDLFAAQGLESAVTGRRSRRSNRRRCALRVRPSSRCSSPRLSARAAT